jgi:tetratricopeptide (TPR) repeat protein
MYLKTLLVDGGASVFNLTILTTNLEATESAQTEILDSYTYDPDLAAELLAERAVAAEVEEALAAAEANIEAEAYEEAIADYDTAIELDPENFLAYAGRAWVHQQMEEYDKAIADYSQAIDLDPEEGWAYNERAWTYRLMEAYEEALPDVNKALQLDPESAAAYNTRGEIYFELGEMEKAIADLTQAIELGAEYDENYYFRGMAYQAQEETDKAIADLEYFLEISSNSELIAEAEQTLEALQSSGATTEASPTPEEPVAAVDIELEPFEHPSGAFSILIPADSWSTGVDSAAESKYPSLYSNYVEDDIGFGLEAAVFPKPEDAALEDMFDVFLNDVILRGKIDVEVISQEQERLDDDRLLADVALLSPGMAGHPLHQKVLLVDGGTSVFGLVVEDQDLEATEPVWTEILNSYTYDPELTADLLAKY